jgi:hypothetical protein
MLIKRSRLQTSAKLDAAAPGSPARFIDLNFGDTHSRAPELQQADPGH